MTPERLKKIRENNDVAGKTLIPGYQTEAIEELLTYVDELEGYKESLEDKQRLTKELDVALFGDDAAEQASLCDLIGPAEKLRKELKDAKSEIHELQAKIKVYDKVTTIMGDIGLCVQCEAYNKIYIQKFGEVVEEYKKEKV